MPAGKPGDDGFTLIEVMVSIAIISAVMLSLTSFFVVALRVNQQQGNRQVAIQAAESAMEQARAIQTSAILTGRDATSSTSQRANAVDSSSANYIPGIKNVLFTGGTTTNGVVPYDANATAGAGASATLPTSPNTTTGTVTIAGIVYSQYWFFEVCYRTADTSDTQGRDAACTSTTTAPTDTSTYIPMYRLIVAVTWPDRVCASSKCAYLTYSLIGVKTDEPVFNTSIPQIAPPGNLVNDVGVAMSYTFTATGGTDTRTWSATGLPTGLTMTATSGTVTGTPTTVGTYNTSVTVVDSLANKDIATFTWTITKAPVLTNPGTLSTPGGVAVSYTFTVTGGATPLTFAASGLWSSTGLPPGLTMDTTTGVVTGTPTKTGSNTVTLTVTDKSKATSTVAFVWTVPALALTAVVAQTSKIGTAITPLQLAATGGISPYVSWAATNLPAGLTLDTSTGVVSGTPTTILAVNTVTFTVTDTGGNTASTTAAWVVTL